MDTNQEVLEQFRALHAESVERYEEELEISREQQPDEEELRLEEEEARSLLHDSGLDAQRLDQIDERDQENLRQHLEEVRPRLVDRPVTFDQRFREASAYSALAADAGAVNLWPFATSVFSPDAAALEDIEGERGNPWVIQYNPQVVDIAHFDEGWGRGCQATAAPQQIHADILFNFIPDTTGWWEFNAFLGFSGFYILRANDGFWNCKRAYLRMTVYMSVRQYHWHPTSKFTVIRKGDDNINEYRLYDEFHKFTDSALLKAGDRAWLLVQIVLYSHARGSGSYAELNFSDGLANSIKPIMMLARPT